jgi:hypothetical protein
MGKRSEKRKRRVKRARERGKLMVETLHRLVPNSKITYCIDQKKQKVSIKVKPVKTS